MSFAILFYLYYYLCLLNILIWDSNYIISICNNSANSLGGGRITFPFDQQRLDSRSYEFTPEFVKCTIPNLCSLSKKIFPNLKKHIPTPKTELYGRFGGHSKVCQPLERKKSDKIQFYTGRNCEFCEACFANGSYLSRHLR